MGVAKFREAMFNRSKELQDELDRKVALTGLTPEVILGRDPFLAGQIYAMFNVTMDAVDTDIIKL